MSSLSDNEIKRIIDLYVKDELTQREIVPITGHSLSCVKKYCKGLRSLSDALILARKKGRCVLTEEGRKRLSESGKNLVKKNRKYWTKPEREFKNILNQINIGVRFPEYIKQVFELKDDLNPEIYFQYPIQRYVCDFVDVDRKIVYRVNGDFWHGNPILYTGELNTIQKHNKKQDRNCKIFLERRGFFVCDIWESDIYWNKELVIKNIRATREKANPLALHARDTGSVTQAAHCDDWSKRLKELWFIKIFRQVGNLPKS